MKATKDAEIKVKINIRPGPATHAMKAAWHKFWQKLIAETKGDDNAKKKND